MRKNDVLSLSAFMAQALLIVFYVEGVWLQLLILALGVIGVWYATE